MEIKDITFSYADKVTRLHDIGASIATGKITTILGPNGSGKSTLLGVLTNNLTPEKGSIILGGKATQQYKPKELAKKLGVVHQQNSAPADMTVEKLVYYGRLPHKQVFSQYADEDDAKVKWALERVGLYERKDVPMDSLSGGQQQRVWIAMALAQDTPYLFLDEPTANLDIYYQYEILELVRELCREEGLTIVMVLHDINQAIAYSDEIIAMKDGRIISHGNPKEIITPELMREVYNVHVVIKDDPELGMYLIPVGI
jgi:iron complex transport system ATP-binding protein